MAEHTDSHIIIGTAGHVDHGKTTLIRALTGIDTDRLKEEKERGMTIDLGFASFKLPGGKTVGIVDVPGHERFLKNMLAGATGVDVVILVIAADEGVMPQTQEHLEILQLLDATNGVIALTKIDMVDADWLDLVEEDVRKALKGTFLESSPIVRVSGVSGHGVSELAAILSELVDKSQSKSSIGPFRLPIDRVFTSTGFGTVVTGTLVSGTVRVGDTARLLPQGIDTRVRQIQVHGNKEQEALAGTRVAVNIAGVEMEDVGRGSVLVPQGYLTPADRIDVYIKMLPDAPKPLKSRTRIRIHIGTAEHIGRVTVLGASEIAAGQEGYAQFASETPVVAARGDKFVIRSYSPMRTIAGGTVLDSNASRHKASDPKIISVLANRRKGEPADLIEDVLLASPGPVVLKDIVARTGLSENEVKEVLAKDAGRFRALDVSRYIHPAVLTSLNARITAALEDFHKSYPLKAGMPREDVRSAVSRNIDSKSFAAVIAYLESEGRISTSESTISLSGHTVELNSEQSKAAEAIEKAFLADPFNPPSADEAIVATGQFGREVFQYLVDSGKLVKIEEGLFLHNDAIGKAENLLREHLSDGSKITVSQFRDLTGSSRKFVVPILEYFDSKRITRRIGDERVLAVAQR